MELSNLFNKVKEFASNEDVKNVAKAAGKKLASNKKVQKAVSKVKKEAANVSKKVAKVAKSTGLDLTQLVSLATNNTDVVNALAKLGLKKGDDPGASSVQKLVGTLKSKVSSAIGVKVEDKTFSSLVSKLLSNATVKSQVEKISGTGVATFIKKAVAEYIA